MQEVVTFHIFLSHKYYRFKSWWKYKLRPKAPPLVCEATSLTRNYGLKTVAYIGLGVQNRQRVCDVIGGFAPESLTQKMGQDIMV